MLLPGNSVTFLEEHVNFHCNYSSADKTKHNSIWSKALSMPLTVWSGLFHGHQYLLLGMLVLHH